MTGTTLISQSSQARTKLRQVESAIETSIRGKTEAVRLALVCLLARGHLLIEDVPGVGKTTLAQSLARSVDGTPAQALRLRGGVDVEVQGE